MRLIFWLTALVGTQALAQKFEFAKLASTPYSAETGFGLESRPGETPIYFSVRVPAEGNYKVTVKFGDKDRDSVTTVKAELRRLMLERVRTKAGKYETRTFIVNVRRPGIPGGGQVRLKDREKTSEAWAWDDKLTLEFTDAQPAVRSVEVEKVDRLPTLYIAGDSTSTDQPLEPFNSWGQMITRFFKPEIAVANHGESGESLKGFLSEGRLDKVMSLIQPGDYLFIQMGHNDQKEKGEGVGAMTTYKADLKHFIAVTREHGATPVVITPVNRMSFESGTGKIVSSLGDYPEAVRQTTQEENVALIDLNAMSKPFYDALGPEQAHVAFAGNDNTHHSNYGSYELAKCVVEGIKAARLPLVKYLVDMPKFDPANPDPFERFDIPAEPAGPAIKPYGN